VSPQELLYFLCINDYPYKNIENPKSCQHIKNIFNSMGLFKIMNKNSEKIIEEDKENFSFVKQTEVINEQNNGNEIFKFKEHENLSFLKINLNSSNRSSFQNYNLTEEELNFVFEKNPILKWDDVRPLIEEFHKKIINFKEVVIPYDLWVEELKKEYGEFRSNTKIFLYESLSIIAKTYKESKSRHN
jgi:hypothetical protein